MSGFGAAQPQVPRHDKPKSSLTDKESSSESRVRRGAQRLSLLTELELLVRGAGWPSHRSRTPSAGDGPGPASRTQTPQAAHLDRYVNVGPPSVKACSALLRCCSKTLHAGAQTEMILLTDLQAGRPRSRRWPLFLAGDSRRLPVSSGGACLCPNRLFL